MDNAYCRLVSADDLGCQSACFAQPLMISGVARRLYETPVQMQPSFEAARFRVLPFTPRGEHSSRLAQDCRQLFQCCIGVGIELDAKGYTLGEIFCRRAVRLSEHTYRGTEHMRFGMRRGLVDALADAINEIRRSDADRL